MNKKPNKHGLLQAKVSARSAEELLHELQVQQTKLEMQKEALRQAQLAEVTYESLFENMLNGVAHCRMIFDNDTPVDYLFLRVNLAYEKVTGLKGVEGRKVSDVIPGYCRDNPESLKMFGRVAQSGEPTRWEHYLAALDRWYVFSIYSPAQGEFIVIIDDISVRKRAEAALLRSEMEFRTLAEAMPQIVWMARADGWNNYINQQWVDYTGLTLEESCGHGWNKAFHPDDQQRAWDAWQHATKTGDAYALECRLRRADGTYRWWLVRAVPLYDAKGEILKWLGTATDIEELKQAESEIQQLNTNLEEKVAARTAQLTAINKELETFSYSVSHDLKAPLRGIDGYAQLLLQNHAVSLNPEGQAFVANICHGAQLMSQLIDDLLAYSRLERRNLQTIRVAPKSIADAVIAEYAEEIRRRNVALNVNIPCLEANADADGLAMILRNLVDNALKFTRDTPQPMIEIGGREEAGTCMLWVRDNGIGFDMRFHERIFEIFQRLQRAEDYSGTGIGLTMVRKAAQRMGGRVWAESTPGFGATFFVELPK